MSLRRGLRGRARVDFCQASQSAVAVFMSESLKIIVADDEVDMRDFYRSILSGLGHTVVAVAETGQELVDACAAETPELIITDIRMPDLDGLDALREITRAGRPVPAIVVSGFHDEEFIQRAQQECVLAYLVKPVRASDLEPAIKLARQRFREMQALQQQADDLRQALEDRKQIERAKGILMDRSGMSESEAFKRLQKLSNDRNQKLVEIARAIITAEEAFA